MHKSPANPARPAVLLLAPSLCIGGAELVVSNLARNMDGERYDVRVGYIKKLGEIGESLIADGYRVDPIAPPGIPGGHYLTFLNLRKYVRRENIRIVHTHGVEAMVDAALCRRITSEVRVMNTFHFGNYPHIRPGNRRLESLFWRGPDSLIAVGTRQCASIRETYGIPEDRISTVYNGVVEHRSDIDQELLAPYLNSGKVLIGSISTMIEQKGIPDLLEVAAALRQRTDRALFLVAGDGRLREKMIARRDAMGLQDTVQFFGWVNDAAVTFLPALDIFLQTSLWEAMSMVILEAMAARKAIVATDVGDNRFMIDDGRTGALTQPKDVAGMTDALEKLCADPSLRERYGADAEADYRNKFTVDVMVRRYQLLYDGLLKS
ncbi:MAG: glycosyltransferase [Acidobacteria bacterium]|uniref:Glycosyltransferase n=1 Tax=Candidatus Polarisedimenticola svalbardensis TaxID=2886004 RepID=A0A8J6Y259_9BACT|nr:glycosyltransferase [Candidatus Polarisedimenticola svalbardensis]